MLERETIYCTPMLVCTFKMFDFTYHFSIAFTLDSNGKSLYMCKI